MVATNYWYTYWLIYYLSILFKKAYLPLGIYICKGYIFCFSLAQKVAIYDDKAKLDRVIVLAVSSRIFHVTTMIGKYQKKYVIMEIEYA